MSSRTARPRRGQLVEVFAQRSLDGLKPMLGDAPVLPLGNRRNAHAKTRSHSRNRAARRVEGADNVHARTLGRFTFTFKWKLTETHQAARPNNGPPKEMRHA